MAFAQLLDEGSNLNDLDGVQTDGWLIQDDDLGIAHQGLGDAHPLAIALGKSPDEAVADLCDAGAFHDCVQLVCQLLFLQTLGFPYKGQVLQGSLIDIDRGLLRQVADESLGLLRLLQNVKITDLDKSLRGGETAGHNVHSGGFPGSVGSQKAVDMSVFNLEGQVIDSQKVAIVFG